ncbi:nitrite/sulfite reductase, partial [Kitasatospora sp. NPDC001574]
MATTPETAEPTADAAPARRPAAPRKVTRHRGEGQWGMGHFTPLNANEQFKKDDDGLNVRTRIETIYAHRGFDSIDPADLRGRMRWWGLYTQRKEGIDGGKTAILDPHELDAEYFMLRVRIDGGRLTVAQLRAVAEVSQEYGRNTADLTDRQNVQYHWIRIEDV